MKILVKKADGEIKSYGVAEVKSELGLGSNFSFIGAEPAPKGHEWGVALNWKRRDGGEYPVWWTSGKLVSGQITHDFASEP